MKLNIEFVTQRFDFSKLSGLLVFLLVFPLNVQEQTDTIRDAKTNEPLIDTSALVEGNKKEKFNQKEQEQESEKASKKTRNQYSAVESSINKLEHRGLGSCSDKSYAYFNRYVGLGVCAYNLHRIGAELMRRTGEKRLKQAAKSESVHNPNVSLCIMYRGKKVLFIANKIKFTDSFTFYVFEKCLPF